MIQKMTTAHYWSILQLLTTAETGRELDRHAKYLKQIQDEFTADQWPSVVEAGRTKRKELANETTPPLPAP